jgi:hypothetical protein
LLRGRIVVSTTATTTAGTEYGEGQRGREQAATNAVRSHKFPLDV